MVHGLRSRRDKGKGGGDELDAPHLATYSLIRLRKIMRVGGGRHLLPLPEEITAIEVGPFIKTNQFLAMTSDSHQGFCYIARNVP